MPLVHPSVADTLVEGVRVVFDDWTDDMDHSIDRPVPVPPPASRAPERPLVTMRERVAPLRSTIDQVSPPSMETVRLVPPAPPRRSWLRVATLLVAIAVVVSLFFAVGGFGALLVVLAAAAGAVLMVMPSGIDVVVVPSAPAGEVEIVAPQGESDADLVVMPDPGFRGGVPMPKPTKPK